MKIKAINSADKKDLPAITAFHLSFTADANIFFLIFFFFYLQQKHLLFLSFTITTLINVLSLQRVMCV